MSAYPPFDICPVKSLERNVAVRLLGTLLCPVNQRIHLHQFKGSVVCYFQTRNFSAAP